MSTAGHCSIALTTDRSQPSTLLTHAASLQSNPVASNYVIMELLHLQGPRPGRSQDHPHVCATKTPSAVCPLATIRWPRDPFEAKRLIESPSCSKAFLPSWTIPRARAIYAYASARIHVDMDATYATCTYSIQHAHRNMALATRWSFCKLEFFIIHMVGSS